ncbi:Hypothetical predicted protein [Olea europaea subsp. europaea]|uniref:Uncharacterized protein n=1 Tax=Olea europaea subsp. europaea TaxID=158383 RepID=A0A8S0PZA7_OLEEU|nr:Hypothetical predicted protein [Olea europaea subsp. europaea]
MTKDSGRGDEEIFAQQTHNVVQCKAIDVFLSESEDVVNTNSTENQAEILEEGEVEVVSGDELNTVVKGHINSSKSSTKDMEGGSVMIDANHTFEQENTCGNVTDGGSDGEKVEDGHADCNSDSELGRILKGKNKDPSVRFSHRARARPGRLNLLWMNA